MTNAILVFGLVFVMRKFDLGVSLLGYGIVSIAGYLIFLVWSLIDISMDNPDKTNEYPVFTWNFATLCDTLATAFSLQGVFIPILRKNKNQ